MEDQRMEQPAEELLQIKKQHDDFALVRKLSDKLGVGLTSTNGNLARNDGGIIPEDTIESARKEVEQDHYWFLLKQECARRILKVTKDGITQLNIVAAALISKDAADINKAQQLVQWMGLMRDTARRMRYGRNNFAEDRYWPKAPAGAKELAEKF
jgi:hypothetical protein